MLERAWRVLQPDALTAARCTAKGVVCICLGLAGVDDWDDEQRVEAAVRGWLPTYAATCPPTQVRSPLACCNHTSWSDRGPVYITSVHKSGRQT